MSHVVAEAVVVAAAVAACSEWSADAAANVVHAAAGSAALARSDCCGADGWRRAVRFVSAVSAVWWTWSGWAVAAAAPNTGRSERFAADAAAADRLFETTADCTWWRFEKLSWPAVAAAVVAAD